MKFLREIPTDRLPDDILTLENQEGIVLVWKEDSVEIWYQVKSLTTNGK